MSTPPVVAEALKRFHRAAESEDEQRKAILAAKNFRAGNQWPEEVKLQRQGAPAIQGLAAQPARPCLTIDRVSGPVRIVSNMVRTANFEIDCSPVGDGADKETATIFKGWMRRIQNEARAEGPVDWAADQAAEGGIGWFRLTAYEVNNDPDLVPPEALFDQDLRMDRVPNNLSIYSDPAAIKPTRSDAKFLFATENLPREEFERLYPEADLNALDEFRATGDGDGWVTEDEVRVAEYWRVEYENTRLVETMDGRVLKGDAAKGLTKDQIKRERIVRTPRVKWSKITACEELEKTDWLGSRIPFIPILGEELNVDGKAIVRGVIAPAMDAQRMVNYTFSAAVESAALAPKAPFVAAEGQTDNYKALWQTANTANHSVLPYTPVSLLGQPVPPPQRNSSEPPIQAMVELMVRSEDSVKATTTIYDPSLGNTNPKEKSGRAILALQQQSELGQSNYQDNVTRALIYAGELMVELGPKLLDRPGRIIQILQLDDSPQQVMLGQPFTHSDNGVPQPVQGPGGQPVQDPEHAKLLAGMAKFYDLSGGKYGVTVTIGRARATQRQEANGILGDLLPHLPPPMAAALTPSFIETLDFPDAQKMADIAKKALPPELQQAISDDKQPQVPPEIAQQLQQLQQGIQLRDQALQQAKQIIDTKQVEKAADIQKAKLDGTKEILIHQMDNARAILVAHITAAKEGATTQMEGDLEFKATGLKLAHEAFQSALDRAHEFRMAQLGHAQSLEENAQTHDQALEQGDQATQGQLAVQAAQPEPQGVGA